MKEAWKILVELTCPVCGKTFVPAPEHAYKVDRKTVCSYHCLCDWIKKNGKDKAYTQKNGRKYTKEFKAEAVRMVVEDGKHMSEVSKELGVSYNTLFGWVQRYKEWRYIK